MALAAVFPAAVFGAATFFLLGDWGPYNDDWSYIHRDAATGDVQSLIQQRPVHYWRPLFRITVPPLLTLLWKDMWACHLISALVHAGAALLLWRMLLALGLTRLAAALGAMFFALYPVHFEVLFWPSALPTILSTSASLIAMLLAIRHARGGSAWCIAAIGLIAFAAACWNEQPACILSALPFVYLVVRPDDEPIRAAIARAAGPTAAALAAIALYVGIHVALGFRKPAIGHDALTVPWRDMGRAARELVYWARGRHLLHDFSRPATADGWAALRAHPLTACLFAALVAISVGPWVARHADRGDQRPRARPGRLPRLLPLLGLGGAMFAAGWVPVVALAYWLMPRMAYAPTTGLAVLVAVGIDVVSRQTSGRAWTGAAWRTTAALTGALISLAFALMLIGVQAMFQKRTRQDAREAAALHAMLPGPARSSMFAPVRVDPPRARPRQSAFDLWFYGAFASSWSAPWIVRYEYGRPDLGCGRCRVAESGFITADEQTAAVRFGGHAPWDRVIPFTIDCDGRVTLVDTVILLGPDGSRRECPVPQVRALDRETLVRAGFNPPVAFTQSAP